MTDEIVNIKFKSDFEKRMHARFKARCALEGVSMNDKFVQLAREYLDMFR